MREQVLQGFEEQRALVDALTNVSIPLQLNQVLLKSYITNLALEYVYSLYCTQQGSLDDYILQSIFLLLYHGRVNCPKLLWEANSTNNHCHFHTELM